MPLFKLVTPSTRSAQKFEVSRWFVNKEIDEDVWAEMIAKLQKIMNCRSTYFYITWFDGEDHCTVEDIHDLKEAVEFNSQSSSKNKAIRLYASLGKREHLTVFGEKPSSAEFGRANQAEETKGAPGCPYPNQSGEKTDALNPPQPTIILPSPEEVQRYSKKEALVSDYQGNLGFEDEPQGTHSVQPSAPRASNSPPYPSVEQMTGPKTGPGNSKNPLFSKYVADREYCGESSGDEEEEEEGADKARSPGIKKPKAYDQTTMGDAGLKKREEELSRRLKELRTRGPSDNPSKDPRTKDGAGDRARGQTASKAENSKTKDDEYLRSYISALRGQGLDLDESTLKKILKRKDQLQNAKRGDKNKPDHRTQSAGARSSSEKSDESFECVSNGESSDSYPDDYPKESTEPHPFKKITNRNRGDHQTSGSTKKEPVVIPSPSISSPSAPGTQSQGGGRRTPNMRTKPRGTEGVRGSGKK
ncbi:unnamed protein product [Calicophoron daubneyi]|uniref:PB1 domain-containing protein n=1 Tax=Calicophoron daubneyi TaxID=300641 RepID=A0AAV2TMB9_CALDB